MPSYTGLRTMVAGLQRYVDDNNNHDDDRNMMVMTITMMMIREDIR